MPSYDVLLAVDPGARGCGCAWGYRERRGGELSPLPWTIFRAAYVTPFPGPSLRGETTPRHWRAVVQEVVRETTTVAVALSEHLTGEAPGRTDFFLPTHVVVERMQVYPRSKGDPNDLFALAAVGGGLFSVFSFADPIGLLPHQWKGTVPRDIMGNRVEKHLRKVPGEWEKVVIPHYKKHLNDVMHAVGLLEFMRAHPHLETP